MNRYRYLGKNIGILTLSNFASKFLTFILVPIYTTYLSTEEYGQFDFVQTTINLLLPIITLNIAESVLRFLLEEQEDTETVISIGIKWTVIGIAIICVASVINVYFHLLAVIENYSIFFILIFITLSMSTILINTARGLDKLVHLAISSVLATVGMLGSCIMFLCVFHWGLSGYFLSNLIGPLIQSIYLFFALEFWNYIKWRKINLYKEKKMLLYSCPLIVNSIAWWINSVSDRYVVIWFCGFSVSGIYAVASKIPGILNVFQSIFNQAWTLSAVKDFDKDDKNGFFSTMYNSYNALMVTLCSLLVLLDKPIAKLLYAKEFYEGWKYAPFLMMGIIFGAISGYIGGIFSAVKDSKEFAKSTAIGAIANILMNIILVPLIGAMGAAIATAVSYWMVYCLRITKAKKYINMRTNLSRDNFTYILIVAQIIALLNTEGFKMYIIQSVICAAILLLYYREFSHVIKNFPKRCKR